MRTTSIRRTCRREWLALALTVDVEAKAKERAVLAIMAAVGARAAATDFHAAREARRAS